MPGKELNWPGIRVSGVVDSFVFFFVFLNASLKVWEACRKVNSVVGKVVSRV